MDEEMRKLCEDYAWAWYFDKPHRITLEREWFKMRKTLSAGIKEEFDRYFEECRKKNEETLPHEDHIG